MKRPDAPQGDLLNLPLKSEGSQPEPPQQPLAPQDLLPFDQSEAPSLEADDPTGLPSGASGSPGFMLRLRAGLFDLLIVAIAVAASVIGSWLLDAPLTRSSLPAFVVFSVSFSFLYTVVPLTFWGQTPGMGLMGLVARATDSGPLTIQQTIQRWVGSALTVLLLGSPLVLMITRRSLPDRLSGSRVAAR